MSKTNTLFMDEQERRAELRRVEIAHERGLHLDDDADQIEEILFAEDEAAYERQQEALMESGGSDDSAYRRDMIAAGRGHLLR